MAGLRIAVLLEATLTAALKLLEPVFPLGQFPVPYILLTMTIAYFLSEGAAIVSIVMGWFVFTYFFVSPEGIGWPLTDSLNGWTQQVALLLGVIVVGAAMIQARRSKRRIQRLADESARLNAGLMEEITERKVAEEALTQSKSEVTRILESISDAFFALDRDWHFNYVNNEAVLLLQKSHEQLIGTKIWDQYPEAVGTAFQTEYERAMQERIAVQFEAYYPPFDRWYEVRAYPFEDGLSVYFTDCTERRTAQEILAQASERDRHIADMLQNALLPRERPMQPVGYEIATRYQPALREAEVCGDFYDLIDLRDGKIGIVIGDMLGKGLSAAAHVAAVKQTIRSYAFLDDRPSRVMALVNDALCRQMVSESDLLTAFFAVLDTRLGRLTYTNAGHEPPLLLLSDGRIETLTEGGPMLSIMDVHTYQEEDLVLHSGDLVVLFTDGITESRTVGRAEQFGSEGVVRCITNSVGASAEQIAAAILESATSFGQGELRDDAALVVIKKLDKSGHEAAEITESQSVTAADGNDPAMPAVETKSTRKQVD